MPQIKFILDETTPLFRDEEGAELHIDVHGVATIEYGPGDMNGVYNWAVEGIEIDRWAMLTKVEPHVVKRDEPLWFTVVIALTRYFDAEIQEAIREAENASDPFFEAADAAFGNDRAMRLAAE